MIKLEKDFVVVTDLKEKRRSVRYTQEELGKKLGVGRQQISQYETGRSGIPMDKACILAAMFDCITLQYQGLEFELRHKKGDDEEGLPEVADGAKPVESALNVAKELEDVKRHMESLIEHNNAIRKARCEGRQWITIGVKEVAELVAVGKRYLRSSREYFPEEWKKGMAMAIAELSEEYGLAGVEIENDASVA